MPPQQRHGRVGMGTDETGRHNRVGAIQTRARPEKAWSISLGHEGPQCASPRMAIAPPSITRQPAGSMVTT